jgi:hypothetical protein
LEPLVANSSGARHRRLSVTMLWSFGRNDRNIVALSVPPDQASWLRPGIDHQGLWISPRNES